MSVLAAIRNVTLADVLQDLAQSIGSPMGTPNQSSGAGFIPPTARPPAVTGSMPFPEMQGGTDHKLYALHILAGLPHKQACAEVGCKPRTAEDWKSELRHAVSEYLGREVEYHFAARFVLDPELRHICYPQIP